MGASASTNSLPIKKSPSMAQKVWKKLRDDPVTFTAVIMLLGLYLSVAFAGFLSPYDKYWYDRQIANIGPTPIYTADAKTGELTWPYVYPRNIKFDPQTYTIQALEDRKQAYPIQLFVRGDTYKMFGLIESDLHLFGVDAPARINLLGTDMNGRDNFSRLLYGGQISLTIGFISLFISIPIGLLYGGISGYFGGMVDNLMMRFAEVIMSIPSLFLLVSLATILPPEATSTQRFAMVVAILAFIGWAGFARVIRGMVLSIKNQEFVEAERALGIRTMPLIIRHILPQTASFVIVAMTVGVPGYILAESGLSFLGLGITQPDASWGNMLKEAQEITRILYHPWMLAPGFLIFVAVLSFNVIGDAVRDILDPRSYISKGLKA